MNSNYTKENVIKNDFLFVSYKHDNVDTTVTDTIEYLLDAGIRLWYDADLGTGNNWAKIAESLIKHENCRGVLFFNSADSFLSEPVYRERTFTLEKIETCQRRKDKPFVLFPVHIGKPSTMLLLRDVFASLPTDDKVIEQKFPFRFLKSITDLFISDTLYCYADPDNAEEYKQRLVDDIKKALPAVVDPQALSAKEIAKTFGESSSTVSIGICKGKIAANVPEYLRVKEGRIEHLGATYLVSEGEAYQTQRISWRPVYCTDDEYVLLSENIVDTRNGGEDLKGWLRDRFAAVAFSKDEREAILEIRLLTEADVAMSKDPELLIFSGCDSHWWLDARGAGALQKVVKKDGSVYHGGYNFRAKKSGVRPVIRVKKEFISAINGN